MNTRTGVVKMFNEVKGFGFIAPDGGGPEVFVQAAGIATAGVKSLRAGQRVSFIPEPGPKVVNAMNVQLI